jgi:hypothetical protein
MVENAPRAQALSTGASKSAVPSKVKAIAVTSATRGVKPVTTLDGFDVDSGPLLGELKTLWEQRADADPDPAPLAS